VIVIVSAVIEAEMRTGSDIPPEAFSRADIAMDLVETRHAEAVVPEIQTALPVGPVVRKRNA